MIHDVLKYNIYIITCLIYIMIYVHIFGIYIYIHI